VNRWLALTSFCLATGCGGSGRGAAPPPAARADGLFRYSAVIPGYQPGSTLRVQGSLIVTGDSLLAHPESGCGVSHPRGTGPASPAFVTVSCGSASLNFDVRNMNSGRWIANVQVPKQRNACVEYEARDATRQRRCIRSRPETYYVTERRSGAVKIEPIR
jgi:hypothetical protein